MCVVEDVAKRLYDGIPPLPELTSPELDLWLLAGFPLLAAIQGVSPAQEIAQH